MPELVNHARNNHTRWRELDEAGVSSLADVKRAMRQQAIQAPPTSTSEPTAEEWASNGCGKAKHSQVSDESM